MHSGQSVCAPICSFFGQNPAHSPFPVRRAATNNFINVESVLSANGPGLNFVTSVLFRCELRENACAASRSEYIYCDLKQMFATQHISKQYARSDRTNPIVLLCRAVTQRSGASGLGLLLLFGGLLGRTAEANRVERLETTKLNRLI